MPSAASPGACLPARRCPEARCPSAEPAAGCGGKAQTRPSAWRAMRTARAGAARAAGSAGRPRRCPAPRGRPATRARPCRCPNRNQGQSRRPWPPSRPRPRPRPRCRRASTQRVSGGATWHARRAEAACQWDDRRPRAPRWTYSLLPWMQGQTPRSQSRCPLRAGPAPTECAHRPAASWAPARGGPRTAGPRRAPAPPRRGDAALRSSATVASAPAPSLGR
mmetsp:Transcript_85531/g.261566  ORF Transcript_85531/g.261566 Transcript_85531/m.261566 type:complete len:221 (-) Transcript_85531:87-749(-)